MAIPLFIGYFSNNLLIGSFGSLGIFTFLYYQTLPFKDLMIRLSSVGSFLLLGNLLGMLSTHVPWVIPIMIALIAFLARIIFRLYAIAKPGAFFIVMVTAMGSGTKIPLDRIPIMMSYVLLGVITSLVVAVILYFVEGSVEAKPVEKKISLQERLYIDPAALLDALHYAAILFLATYISQSLHLTNAYWMIVSCAAVLQGDNLRAIMHRNVQRIFGTMVGLLIAALLLSIAFTTLQSILLICFFFLTVEFFIKRNYAIANFFTTPMSLLLANLARHQYLVSLLNYRLIGIVLGSLLGLLGAYVLTTCLRFYNRAYQLDENLDKETE
ncbi:FUSC family protein [Enterococcus wangshanyuanii]|uniref:FUSC family protein n=2 Tax=Enterococcus wangshanyuanii TaxID=2005703 RepID=A0ABQ1P9L9_9ENTE|nr:FUSC family protein [Enterococcus wangshanyuanii]GGC93931.1 FUSC family protein [Enterococcus wangshanyuanii]